MLAAVESVWAEKLHDATQKYKNKATSLQERLKVCLRHQGACLVYKAATLHSML